MRWEDFSGVAFLALIGLGGAAALARAPQLEVPEGLPVADGRWSAAVEDAFSASLPHHEPSIWAWTAAELALFGDGRPGVVVGDEGWLFTAEELRQAPDDAVARAAAVIARTRDRLAERDAALVVALLPSKARIYRDKLGDVALPGTVDARYAALREALLRAGVNTPDLQAALSAARGEVFMRADTHWSPLGAVTVARAIADSLPPELKSSLASASYTLAPLPEMEHEGDLLRYVPLGPFARLGPGKERVQSVEAQGMGAVGLLGEASYPVVAVGTSYTAQDTWGFVAALQAELSADVLELAEEGEGPFTPMETWVGSPSFGENPPRLVVWEIPERYLALEEMSP